MIEGSEEVDAHQMLQDRIRVLLITTPKRELTTCRVDEQIEEAKSKSRADDFDFLPVVSARDEIVGVFHTKTEYAGAAQVDEVYERLNTEMLIGGNASIVDFVETAHENPFRFVVSKNGIVGIVTLSDLQKFPARASLFTLIMDFELLLSEAIEGASGPHFESWFQHLDADSCRATKGYVTRAKKEGRYVNDLLVTSLASKFQITGALYPVVQETLARLQEPVKGLRDRLAHADVLDNSLAGLKQVSLTVRDILECRRRIEASMRQV